MKIAIASGKGGTGKTTIATALAISLQSSSPTNTPAKRSESDSNKLSENLSLQYIDCDVEAPNAHLYLFPDINDTRDINIPIPEVNPELCTYCGQCSLVCQFHAITVIGKNVMVFPQLCHGCGSCTMSCPEKAITEIPGGIGFAEKGTTKSDMLFFHGLLNVGEPMAVPVIRQLKKWAFHHPLDVSILDSPPGNSCPMVETVRGVDFVLLVTEPTPFGFHDLKMAVQIINDMGIPGAIILNRDGIGQISELEKFAEENQTPIIMRIPYERQVAEATAKGYTLLDIHPEYKKQFQNVFTQISALVESHENR